MTWVHDHLAWFTHFGTIILGGGIGAVFHKFWEPIKEKLLSDAIEEGKKLWLLIKVWLEHEADILAGDVKEDLKTEVQEMVKNRSNGLPEKPQQPKQDPPAPAATTSDISGIPPKSDTPPGLPEPFGATKENPVLEGKIPISGGFNARKGAASQTNRGIIGGGGTNLRKKKGR